MERWSRRPLRHSQWAARPWLTLAVAIIITAITTIMAIITTTMVTTTMVITTMVITTMAIITTIISVTAAGCAMVTCIGMPATPIATGIGTAAATVTTITTIEVSLRRRQPPFAAG